MYPLPCYVNRCMLMVVFLFNPDITDVGSLSSPSVPDVDECTDVPGACGTAQCRNLIGTYECLCDVGYVYNNETKSCDGASDSR